MKKIYYLFLIFIAALSTEGYSQIPTDHLQLWLKADAGTILNGIKVERWTDQSGNGNDAIESDTSRQPEFIDHVLNGFPVIRFDGYNDRLGFTGSKEMNVISLFIVVDNKSGATGPNAPGFILTFGPGGTFVPNQHFAIKMRGMDDGDDDIIVGTEDHTDYVKAVGINIAKYDEWRNMTIVRNQNVYNTTLRWNGNDALMYPSGNALPISVPLGDSSASGGGIGSTDGFPDLGRVVAKCDIAEIIVYDTLLSDSNKFAIEGYLSNKYGITATAVVSSGDKNIPDNFTLYQNYPNPFNPTTTIKYSIPSNETVHLKVYDILGKEVMTLVNENQNAGNYSVDVDASKLSSGVYFYRMQAGQYAAIRKMLLLK